MSSSEEGAISSGFAAVSASDARVLVLGSLPGVRSITEQQYYAHPQNAFWPIMQQLFSIEGDYPTRCRQLTDTGIALWDVLASSHRPGSMDADIAVQTAQANDFRAFLHEHRDIRRVCFNGKKAEALFRRLVMLEDKHGWPELCGLPSTSPAYASMSFEQKLSNWRGIIEPEIRKG